ncbi:hypothetical protein [Fodinicola feengrottensis]|uniref:Radical SAM protein n=1 Tax=Fodinicola feengrottensis TaxID=435914 RepID=A0ABP4URG6_9ACTN|nr:hypothetical protein [Fodinicola feengrottensis]
MSYTLAFFAVPLAELTARLAGIDASADDRAQRTYDVLRVLGRPIDSITHSSAGGEWFRDQFVATALAGIIGAGPAGHLLDRPLAGMQWSYQPTFGWLTGIEVADTAARLEAADLDDPDDPESAETLESLLDILRMAVLFGDDLVTVYH